MSKKKIVIDVNLKQIKKAMQDKKAIYGTEQVIKSLKNKSLSKVFITANCPQAKRESIEYYGKLASIECINIKTENDELGTICKRRHLISVIGLT